ncbi:MAG: response regulator transcription factor [Defluviitaleaceae bacterium]|nr:response regulator transcription factor [Defluviitaleaceae bacterium]
MHKILLVEDDTIIASGLVYALEKEGFFVVHSATITAAVAAVSAHKFDAAVLDVGLPDGIGFSLVDGLRAIGASVLFLTAVDDEGNIVRAFEAGAEDFVTKPFRLGELMARIKAILRRRSGGGNMITLGKVSINISEGKVYTNNVTIELTALEYRLLLVFAGHKGQTLTRGQILNLIWDSEGIFVEDNTLTVYIKRLREKLGTNVTIETVRGVGYRANDN